MGRIDPTVGLAALVERAVRELGDRLAIASKHGALTYEELWAESGRIGALLQAVGVRRGHVVGLGLTRSVEAFATMLAIFRCGAAYVPLEPRSPEDYLTAALLRADAVAVATSTPFAGRFAPSSLPVVAVETPTADPLVPVASEPSDLAYILFTSGSTGPPKAVAIEQGGLVNLVAWHVEEFGVAPDSRAAQGSRLVFDASVWEVWPYLAVGASVHLVPESLRAIPSALQRWYHDNQIDFAFLVSGLAEQLMELSGPVETTLQVLFTGGERLRRRPPAELAATVVNAYGPTEATVVATAGIVTSDEGSSGPPTIGRPITGVDVHILDEQGDLCPAGSPGEIWVGGVGVARGYVHDDDLTRERFVPDPFAACDGATMYRTGDLGFVDEAGDLHYLGRNDGQVKVRGQRIDIDQVEDALSSLDGILACAVVVAERGSLAVLHAFLVPSPSTGGSDFDVAAMKRSLASRVPDHLCPDHYEVVAGLPLTESGKVDRHELVRRASSPSTR